VELRDNKVNILLIGPYLGSFKEEILNFRPYARWLYDVMDYDRVYINTHSNRKFLYYDFLEPEYVISIFENISRDELAQNGFINDDIDQKNYSLIVKSLKDYIACRENIDKKDIDQQSLNYVKNYYPIETHKKRFEKIERLNFYNEYEDKIVFIPDESSNRKFLFFIKEYLDLEYFDYVIAGDKRTYFQEENVVVNRIDYFSNGWKYNIKLIQDAKAVICPISHWTTLCNLHNIPVFSWGSSVGQHRPNGIYHFNNKKCFSFPVSNSTKSDCIIDMLNCFLKEIK
jgi:hypothetical protein